MNEIERINNLRQKYKVIHQAVGDDKVAVCIEDIESDFYKVKRCIALAKAFKMQTYKPRVLKVEQRECELMQLLKQGQKITL